MVLFFLAMSVSCFWGLVGRHLERYGIVLLAVLSDLNVLSVMWAVVLVALFCFSFGGQNGVSPNSAPP